jgi:Spy/CpxP family protein refolding chaperone
MTTRYKLAGLAFSVGILTAIAAMPAAHAETGPWGAEMVTNGPQMNPGDRSGSWSAQLNVRDSQRYEAMLQTNRSFRANRMQKECGPIDDQQLHANCVASFGRYEGSSRPSGYPNYR